MKWTIILLVAPLLSILTFWFLFRNRPEKLESRLIREHSYFDKITKRERINTVISLLIFTLCGLGLDHLEKAGFTRIYTETDAMGLPYLFVSFFLALGINDIYFYFTHRLLHWGPLFRTVHILHHRSHQPNPWSAFSFHPLEAVIQIGVVPLVAFILPINLYVMIGFTSFMLFMSVYGHSGYELRGDKHSTLQIFNTAVHHDQHHEFTHYNFGLYLNIWDRLFKTNHPSYKKMVRRFKPKK